MTRMIHRLAICLGALLFLTSPALAGDKQLGQQCSPNCRTVYRNGKSIQDCNSNCAQGTCKKWINRYFCTRTNKCATRNSTGKSPGATHVHQGKTYVCTNRSSDQFRPLWYLKNGETCSSDFDCSSKRCRKAINVKFCVARSKECGWRDTSGFDTGTQKTYQGKKYVCKGVSFKKASHVGAVCSNHYDCASNKCKNYISGKRCTPRNKDCYVGWISSEGIKINQTINNRFDDTNKSFFQCTASGLKKKLKGGKLCRYATDCGSNRCVSVKLSDGTPILRNGKVCLSAGKTCGWMGVSGYTKNSIRASNGNRYKCQSNGRWKRQ